MPTPRGESGGPRTPLFFVAGELKPRTKAMLLHILVDVLLPSDKMSPFGVTHCRVESPKVDLESVVHELRGEADEQVGGTSDMARKMPNRFGK